MWKTRDLDSVYQRYGIFGKVNAKLEFVNDPDYAEASFYYYFLLEILMGKSS